MLESRRHSPVKGEQMQKKVYVRLFASSQVGTHDRALLDGKGDDQYQFSNVSFDPVQTTLRSRITSFVLYTSYYQHFPDYQNTSIF